MYIEWLSKEYCTGFLLRLNEKFIKIDNNYLYYLVYQHTISRHNIRGIDVIWIKFDNKKVPNIFKWNEQNIFTASKF